MLKKYLSGENAGKKNGCCIFATFKWIDEAH